MGYDIHITRRVRWADDGEPSISLNEWQAVIDGDPELEPVGLNGRGNPCVMMCDQTRRAARYFHYDEGQIFVKKPCTAVLMKMLAIAQVLNARVIGDDDEIYAPDGTPSHKAQFDVTDDW